MADLLIREHLGEPRRPGRDAKAAPSKGCGPTSLLKRDYTEKYSSYSNGCGRCAIGMISAERL